nr:MAG TPA: hypothetical protein [Caudoviricetes sp.]
MSPALTLAFSMLYNSSSDLVVTVPIVLFSELPVFCCQGTPSPQLLPRSWELCQ